jgi:type IV pilus assembly protein PilA
MMPTFLVLGTALGLVICLSLLASWVLEKTLNKKKSEVEEKKRRPSFSLLEGLIATLVLVTISVISVPNLLKSKIAANEASAVGEVRTLNTALIMYQMEYGSFPMSLGQLASGEPPPDEVLTTGEKYGYRFEYRPEWVRKDGQKIVVGYSTLAKPEDKKTGIRLYRSSDSGVIEYSTDGSSWRPLQYQTNRPKR